MTQEKVKLLLVDDKESNLQALERTLTNLDIQILKAHSGNEALRIALTEDIALILLDINMPEMDGYEVAELLRYEEETHHIPIIFVTAYHQEQQHIFKGYEAGAVDYLVKPLNPYILQSKVAVFVKLQQQKQQIIQQAKIIHQAQKMAMLGTLAAGIAHNFNNLLVPIVTFSEITLKHVSNDRKAFKYVKHIIAAAQRARDLVAQILLFSRQDDTKMSPLSPIEILQETIDLLQEVVAANINIVRNTTDSIPMMIGNASKLHQALMNLLLNAADAMPDGGELVITLEKVYFKNWISSQGQQLSGDYVHFSIQDSGCGMDEATLAQSFEPFFSLKKTNGGTGLGLPMVLSIMEHHKGGIDVQSEIGQGSCFQLYFPSLGKSNHKSSYTQEALETKRPDAPTITMLFVDDDAMVRDTLIFAIESESKTIKVIAAEDGLQALEILQTSPEAIDIMVTDQAMPNMTGFQLAEKMRAMGYTFPIILSTGHVQIMQEEELKCKGINAIIQKPYQIETFLALIQDQHNRKNK